MAKKIIIAGGGTGGHIFPAIAIANALKQQEPSIEILFIGAKGKMEMEKVPEAGYTIKGLDIAGFNRSSLIKNIGLPFKLVKSFIQVRQIFRSFQPDAVIGVGGYSSFPVLRYAQSRGIITFIHESNSLAGKTNGLLGKLAFKIFTASDNMQKFFPQDKIMVTGNPVRKEIANINVERDEAIQSFLLRKQKKTVLVIGGSLGAKSINDAVALHIDEFEKNGLQLIWSIGKATANQYLPLVQNRENVWAGEFIREMYMAFAAADIVVSRSGAMSVSELSVVKKPVVFVPFPFASEDHQTANAMHLVSKQAALMIKDDEVKEKLIATVIALSKDEALQQQLKNNIATLAIRNADEIIAKEVLNTIA